MIDKCRKGISNKALKCRICKDAATFGVVDVPMYVRAITKIRAPMLGQVRCIDMIMTATINVESVEPRGIIVKVELQNLNG